MIYDDNDVMRWFKGASYVNKYMVCWFNGADLDDNHVARAFQMLN